MTPKRSSKIDRRILYVIFPSLLLPLIRDGFLSREHLTNPQEARKIIARRSRYAASKMKWSIGLEEGFANSAQEAWKKKKREQSIVLLATSLEQCLNSSLRLIVEAKGHNSHHVTELLRSLNIEPKLTWLFEMYSGKRIPAGIKRRAKKIFEIRNSIVHYKSEYAHPDTDQDSHSKIQKELKQLGRFRPYAFFMKFDMFCLKVVSKCDPNIELALELREQLAPHHIYYE